MAVTPKPVMVIGVMGVTGSGKSSFVRLASGREDVVVGHTLEACTQKIVAYQFSARGYDIVLVDTPGFNDTYKSDTEILLELAKWLEVTYRQNAKLTGIIYLHRITDVRMDGGAMRNLKMFRKLCGAKPMENVVIASTFWGVMPDDKAVAHELELCEKPDFWGDMLEHGAQTMRYKDTHESAIEILMSFASKATVTLDIQRELVDEDIPLEKTAAGNAVNEELHRLEEKYKAEVQRLQTETAAALAERDIELEKILKKEREKMERKLERVHEDQEMLRKERREEIRRIEEQNEQRLALIKRDYDSKFEKHDIVAERQREEDRAAHRAHVRDLQNVNASQAAQFQVQFNSLRAAGEMQAAHLHQEVGQLRASNERLYQGSANHRTSGFSSLGSSLVSMAVSGASVLLGNPLGIPGAIGALVELINEL